MNWKDIPGLTPDADIKAYQELAEKIKPGTVLVEVGVHKGKSIASLVEIIHEKMLFVILVDLWDSLVNEPEWGPGFVSFAKGSMAACRENVRAAGLKPIMICGTSEEVTPFLNGWMFGMVYLDADHRYPGIKADIEAWWPILQSGAILAGHDYGNGNPGVEKAVDEAFGDKVQRAGESIWWVVK